jgi:hypothetical protein
MLAERPLNTGEIRTLVRETQHAARGLIERAAYLEKRARRYRTDPGERADLNSRAQELRTAAELLLADVSELSRQARAAWQGS